MYTVSFGITRDRTVIVSKFYCGKLYRKEYVNGMSFNLLFQRYTRVAYAWLLLNWIQYSKS